MRIMLVSPSMQAGGAERVLTLLASGLARRGEQISLAAPAGVRDADLVGVRHIRADLHDRGRSPAGMARTTAELALILRRRRPEVIHAQNPRMAAMAGVAARLAAPFARAPVLATFHGVVAFEYARSARLLRAVDHVVCVSEELRAGIVAAGLPAARTSVIYNAVEPAQTLSDRQRAALDAELGLNGAPVAAIVARIVPVKAHARFVRAARMAAASVPAARFLVVGDGPLRARTEEQARECGLSDRFVFTGERTDARALIARADVVVFSSDSEGMSIAALEAMAAGTAVLSTDVPGMRELLGGGAGEVVALDDGDALGEGLTRLLLDRGRRAAMGSAGQLLIERRHADAAMIEAYEHRYRLLVSGAPKHPEPMSSG